MAENARLEAGNQLPDFALLNQSGKLISRTDLTGCKLVLYFFPEAATPGCTLEANDFNDHLSDFESLGYRIVGVSQDSVERLEKFAKKQSLKFDLLSDSELALHKATGAWGAKTLFGRNYLGVLRSTLVLDEDLRVVSAEYGVNSLGHVTALLKKLRG